MVAGLAELGADDVAKENAGADAEEGEANARVFAATNVGDVMTTHRFRRPKQLALVVCPAQPPSDSERPLQTDLPEPGQTQT